MTFLILSLFFSFSGLNQPNLPDLIPFSDLHQIELMGLTILEPSTVLSSLMMTAVCIVGFRKAFPYRKQRIAFLTIGFLIFMALATAIGGVLGHGLLYKTGTAGKLPGWICGILALGFYERGVMHRLNGLIEEKLLCRLLWVNIAGLAAFVGLTFYYQRFHISQYHAIYSLLLMIGSMEIFIYRKTQNKGSFYVFLAIACAVLAALAHLSGWGLGNWFQANDVSHIPMAASIWFLYLAMAKGSFQTLPEDAVLSVR